MDAGEKISHLVLKKGTEVFSSDDKRIGVVEHVLSAPEADIFDGITIDTKLGPGGHRFVDAPEVGEIRERAVYLTLDAAACERLPKPSASPPSLDAFADGDFDEPAGLSEKLKRAWKHLSSGR